MRKVHLSPRYLIICPNIINEILQVRSIAAESVRAYEGGPLEPMLYQEASSMFEEGVEMDETNIPISNQYTRRLDWFAVDLEGEHSAMDGQILLEHTEYVVYAIHRVSTFYLLYKALIIVLKG